MPNDKIIINLPDNLSFDDMSSSEIGRVLLHLLQQAVTNGTIPEGYFRLQADYTGSGDSTDSMNWTFVVDSDKTKVAQPRGFEWGNDPNDIVDNWVWNMSTEASPGWYNNEGGYGMLAIDFVGGLVMFEHYNFIQQTEQMADDVLVNLPGEQLERTQPVNLDDLPSGTTFNRDGSITLPEDES